MFANERFRRSWSRKVTGVRLRIAAKLLWSGSASGSNRDVELSCLSAALDLGDSTFITLLGEVQEHADVVVLDLAENFAAVGRKREVHVFFGVIHGSIVKPASHLPKQLVTNSLDLRASRRSSNCLRREPKRCAESNRFFDSGFVFFETSGFGIAVQEFTAGRSQCAAGPLRRMA